MFMPHSRKDPYRATATEDVLAALALSFLAREPRRRVSAAERAQRRADRAFRLALRGAEHMAPAGAGALGPARVDSLAKP